MGISIFLPSLRLMQLLARPRSQPSSPKASSSKEDPPLGDVQNLVGPVHDGGPLTRTPSKLCITVFVAENTHRYETDLPSIQTPKETANRPITPISVTTRMPSKSCITVLLAKDIHQFETDMPSIQDLTLQPPKEKAHEPITPISDGVRVANTATSK